MTTNGNEAWDASAVIADEDEFEEVNMSENSEGVQLPQSSLTMFTNT